MNDSITITHTNQFSFDSMGSCCHSACLHHSDRSSTSRITSEGIPGAGDQSFRPSNGQIISMGFLQ